MGRELGQPGLKPTVRVGEAALREVAAFLLDHDGFAKVCLRCTPAFCAHSVYRDSFRLSLSDICSFIRTRWDCFASSDAVSLRPLHRLWPCLRPCCHKIPAAKAVLQAPRLSLGSWKE